MEGDCMCITGYDMAYSCDNSYTISQWVYGCHGNEGHYFSCWHCIPDLCFGRFYIILHMS